VAWQKKQAQKTDAIYSKRIVDGKEA